MKWLTICAALSAAMAIIAGAFGAHGAAPVAAQWLKTGASYQLIHAVGVLAIVSRRDVICPAFTLLAGAMLFSGTLYAMALNAPQWLGAITPIGGAAMIFGWLWYAYIVWRGR